MNSRDIQRGIPQHYQYDRPLKMLVDALTAKLSKVLIRRPNQHSRSSVSTMRGVAHSLSGDGTFFQFQQQ